jgi:hypothetical protein
LLTLGVFDNCRSTPPRYLAYSCTVKVIC